MQDFVKQHRILLGIGLLAIILGFFGAKYFGGYYFENYSELKPADFITDHYQNAIAQEQDATKAARLGMVFLKTDKVDLAQKAFERAAILDGNWRDAWVWKGYTELKANNPQQALESLKNAEKIDPFYAYTYQLMSDTYQKLGNSDSAKKAQEKVGYLVKNR